MCVAPATSRVPSADTYFIAPSLTLLRSRNPESREVGVGRLNRWHYNESVQPEIVAQGGVEALLAALTGANPETRLTILEVLLRLAPASNARERLLANDGERRVRAACSGLASSDLERCTALAGHLCEVLNSPKS